MKAFHPHKIIFLSLLSTLFLSYLSFGQSNTAVNPNERKVIQFTGSVVTSDSNDPIPFVNVMVKRASKGTITDYFGFFSLVAREGDTIRFSSVGYKTIYIHLPKNIEEDRFFTIQKMFRDTVTLSTKTVRPRPTKEQFAEAFLNLKIDDDDYERAMKNLQQQELNQIRAGTPMDGSLNYKNMMQQQYYSMYYAGQLPPANILNPIAWVKFFDALKKGKLKNPNKK